MNIKKTLQKISSSIMKTILVMVVFFAVVTLFISIANKDKIRIDPEETTKNQRAEIYKLINDPEYQKSDAGKAAIGVYRAMMCGAIGEACTDNPADADENFNHSLFGFVSNLIVMPYANPPASGVQYIAYSMSNAGLLPKAYAAEGIGFASIKPMIEIWKAFRNIAYLILVLVLIAIGFMIMFRMKLNPQTVISLENSLPKIVISLILITFSFAIAGLLIDMMYAGITLIVSLLGSVKINDMPVLQDIPQVQNQYIGSNLLDIWPYKANVFNIIWSVGRSFQNMLPEGLRRAIDTLVAVPVGIFLSKLFLAKPLLFLENIKTANFGLVSLSPVVVPIVLLMYSALLFFLSPHIIGIILGILFLCTLLFLMFRIFFMLLTAYIKIIIFIIASPVFLLFESIPGKNVFIFWFKSLIGEIATFPIVILLILMGYLISHAFSNNQMLFKPPFLFSIDPQSLGALMSMGILLIIPQAVKLTKELLGIKGLPEFKAGFFAGPAVVLGSTMGLLGTISSISMGGMGFKNIAGFLGQGVQGAAQKVKQAINPQAGGGSQNP